MNLLIFATGVFLPSDSVDNGDCAFDVLYPPGTQMLLAIPMRVHGLGDGLWAAAIMWCTLSIAIVWLGWRLARELLSPAAACLVAIFCAISPIFITYGGYFTSETPSLAALLATLWVGVRARKRAGRAASVLALGSGLLGGITAAFRPQLLLNVLIMAIVVAHNSAAANQLTGLATNGGLNFWFGHCQARQLTVFDGDGEQTARFVLYVPNNLGRGGEYEFSNFDAWDQEFFLNLGWECIQKDKLSHGYVLLRNIVDMTATTTPFPQAEEGGWARSVVGVTNVIYCVLLPWIVLESFFLTRRRKWAIEGRGELFFLANLACAAVVALLSFGDPRIRSVYDVFGLALLAAILADRCHLDEYDTEEFALEQINDTKST